MKTMRNYHDYYRIDVFYRRNDPFSPLVHETFNCALKYNPFKVFKSLFPDYSHFCDLDFRVKLVHDCTLVVGLK